MGKKAESLEPCWACFENNDIISTNKKTSLINAIAETKQKHHRPNLTLKINKSLKESNKVSSEIAVDNQSPVDLPLSTDQTVNTEVKTVSHPTKQTVETPSILVMSDLKSVTTINQHEILFPEECMDCVVNEEVVETTESDVTLNSTVPSITLTESQGLETKSEGSNFSDHLLAPPDMMEESSSDYGYESYDSPVSEPDQLVNLFPELW